jgi:hypothetical protein
MAVITLHAGAGKTGTSALQAAFAKNVDQLLAHNIVYPADPSLDSARSDRVTSGNGVPLAQLLGANLSDMIRTDHVLNDIEAAQQAGHDVLYSCEALGAAKAGPTQDFLGRVETMGYRVRVVVYFRSIADHAVSMYHQHVKEGLTRNSLADFVRHEYGKGQRGLVTVLSEVFSGCEIVARNYDRAAADLVNDFLTNALGLSDRSDFVMEQGSVNRSLTETEVALMRAMAPLFETRLQARVASDSIIYGLPQANRRQTISSAAMSAVEELYAGDLEAINALLTTDRPVGLMTDRMTISDDPEPQLSEAERTLAVMIAGLIRSADLKQFR